MVPVELLLGILYQVLDSRFPKLTHPELVPLVDNLDGRCNIISRRKGVVVAEGLRVRLGGDIVEV